MTYLLARIGWSQTELADRLGVNSRTVRRWVSGQNETPPDVVAWLQTVAMAVEAIPQPAGWVSKSDVG